MKPETKVPKKKRLQKEEIPNVENNQAVVEKTIEDLFKESEAVREMQHNAIIELERKKTELTERSEKWEKNYRKKSVELDNSTKEIASLKKEKSSQAKLIVELREQVENLSIDVNNCRKEIARIEAHKEQLKTDLDTSNKELESEKLINADISNQLKDKSEMVHSLESVRERQVKDIQKQNKEIANLKKELSSFKDKCLDLECKLDAEKDNTELLNAKLKNATSKIASKDKEIKEHLSNIEDLYSRGFWSRILNKRKDLSNSNK